jgi:guanine nucleotide-binding protein G(i) subunit alpha
MFNFCSYMTNILRICSPTYEPSKQDILHARSQTITVEEETFEVKSTIFRIIDVGGQRNERKKWLPLFEKVTAFMFFASLVEYDMVLAEAKKENRMKESLQIFSAVSNYHFADNPPPIILFLNKKDLFEKKALEIDLNVCFQDYVGGLNYDLALEHIKNKYLEQNHGKRKVYIFVTCATNTANVKFVFRACSDIILKENLKKSGMYVKNNTSEEDMM